MGTLAEIENLLDQLETVVADALEAQDLDFKEWTGGTKEMLRTVTDWAVCMANGGGGTVIFGVADKIKSRAEAIRGVPPRITIPDLFRQVYDSTDPNLTPKFEELSVPEGTGRLVVMHVEGGSPPYTDTAGRGRIRLGTDCKPLTGTTRRSLVAGTSVADYTATTVDGRPEDLVSAAAFETLADAARRERAPDELVSARPLELLEKLGLIRSGRLTRAGLLLAGKESAIREHVPRFVWTHLVMETDTDYSDRADGNHALPVALDRMFERIMRDNPITTLQEGLLHFEYRQYPEIALRECLLNALSHANFELASPILVKQSDHGLQVSNPGGFVGGVTASNILHHQPAARNPMLVEALVRLRLVNRSHLGVPRMYKALLVEGKEPPIIEEVGASVIVTLPATAFSPQFGVRRDRVGKGSWPRYGGAANPSVPAATPRDRLCNDGSTVPV